MINNDNCTKKKISVVFSYFNSKIFQRTNLAKKLNIRKNASFTWLKVLKNKVILHRNKIQNVFL